MADHTRTYETRIEKATDLILSEYAQLMAYVEHCMCVDIAKGNRCHDLKSSYLKTFKISARQFNSIRISLGGKLSSLEEIKVLQVKENSQRIHALEKAIETIKCKKKLHHKKRRLAKLKRRQIRLESDKPSLCFGSRKLFAAQFHLEENGYTSHEEWKEEWIQERSNEIFLVGSKDEAGGNQSCTPSITEHGLINLRIRLPDALAECYGKYLMIPDLHFAYGHEAIATAICAGNQAITFRFKKDKKGWRVFASLDIAIPSLITKPCLGVIAVDINADHLAVAELDRFGNLVQTHTVPLVLNGLSRNRAKALIGDAATQIISLCEETKKPLVIEHLDFQAKKTTLREKSNAYSRMLSSFAYASVISMLKARGAKKGVAVHSVNPCYTSLIGKVKFAIRYGMTIHHAAALTIGRRFLRLSERMPQGQRDIPDGKGNHVTLVLPVRNRTRHVWLQWSHLQRMLRVALTARFRTRGPPWKSSRSSGTPKATCATV